MYSINIFTLNGCSHCVELKKLLKENNIDFKEFEIGEHKEIFEEVVRLTGHNSLPTTYLQNSETGSGPIFVPGRDYKSKEELLEKIQKFL